MNNLHFVRLHNWLIGLQKEEASKKFLFNFKRNIFFFRMTMTQTGKRMIFSYEDLQSNVHEYIAHLNAHNQTGKLQELLNSMRRHKHNYVRGLEPMLRFMFKHGMPHQFPKDGSHFNDEPESFRCGPKNTTSSEASLIQTSEFW
jgi:hypothetical protein